MPIERARVHTVLAAEPLHIVDLHPGHEGRVHRLHLEPPSRHARQSRPPKPSRSCDTSTGTLSATHVMGLDTPLSGVSAPRLTAAPFRRPRWRVVVGCAVTPGAATRPPARRDARVPAAPLCRD